MDGWKLSTLKLRINFMKYMQKIKICLPVFLFMIIIFTGCYKDKAELLYPNTQVVDCDTIPAKFSNNILPIFQTYCAKSGCHDAASKQGGRTFTNYSEISDAINIIKTRALVQKDMPPAPNTSLPDSNFNKLHCWLESGAPNN